jgi:hypothetical protein
MEQIQEDLRIEIENKFANGPLSHPRAREYYFGLKRRIVDEKIQPDGTFTARRIPIRSPYGTDTIEYIANVNDALVIEATKQDDRFRDIPEDLLQGLARAAFLLGVEVTSQGDGFA